MKQNLHGRLIAAAAKRHLSPLGCRRKGQSRFWSADHGFYQIGIEFQPSGWSKGSYLNVGVQWITFFTPSLARQLPSAAQAVMGWRKEAR